MNIANIRSVFSIKIGDDNYDDSVKLADDYKEQGNKFVAENKHIEALNKFTEAINLNIETKKNSIYYSNRAMIHIKMDNFGLAIEDANKAIEYDPDYLKAYYRRASANLVLGHYDEAVKDLVFLKSRLPGDSGLDDKITKAKVERKKKRFMESIASDRITDPYV
jgi:serine/threonine-protein phosphatase 5